MDRRAKERGEFFQRNGMDQGNVLQMLLNHNYHFWWKSLWNSTNENLQKDIYKGEKKRENQHIIALNSQSNWENKKYLTAAKNI